MRHEKFGVYLNTRQLKAVRVKSLPLDTIWERVDTGDF